MILTFSATLSGSPTDVKERTLDGFGVRLTALRQAQGLTQDELGAAVGISNCMIAYYERDGGQPPGAILVELAKALRVSTDELLGVKRVRETMGPPGSRARFMQTPVICQCLCSIDPPTVGRHKHLARSARLSRARP